MSKLFPREEIYSLTDQIRRSSRSVAANLAEGFRKRRYPNMFVSKLADCDAEATETQVWLDFALECKYLIEQDYQEVKSDNDEVAKLILYMINNPDKFR